MLQTILAYRASKIFILRNIYVIMPSSLPTGQVWPKLAKGAEEVPPHSYSMVFFKNSLGEPQMGFGVDIGGGVCGRDFTDDGGVVEDFLEALRTAAGDGGVQLDSVVDDYLFDSSRWSAGPRRPVAIVGLRLRVVCTFTVPTAAIPEGFALLIDTSHGLGSWLIEPGGTDDDGLDVMRLAFEGRDQLIARGVHDALSAQRNFQTLHGLARLKRRYGVCDFAYRLTAGGLAVSFTAEMEAW